MGSGKWCCLLLAGCDVCVMMGDGWKDISKICMVGITPQFGGKKFKIEIEPSIWREEIQSRNRTLDWREEIQNRIDSSIWREGPSCIMVLPCSFRVPSMRASGLRPNTEHLPPVASPTTSLVGRKWAVCGRSCTLGKSDDDDAATR